MENETFILPAVIITFDLEISKGREQWYFGYNRSIICSVSFGEKQKDIPHHFHVSHQSVSLSVWLLTRFCHPYILVMSLSLDTSRVANNTFLRFMTQEQTGRVSYLPLDREGEEGICFLSNPSSAKYPLPHSLTKITVSQAVKPFISCQSLGSLVFVSYVLLGLSSSHLQKSWYDLLLSSGTYDSYDFISFWRLLCFNRFSLSFEEESCCEIFSFRVSFGRQRE